MGMGNASRRRGADRPISAMMMCPSAQRGMVGWHSVVSVADPFGVGGSGGGVVAPWWASALGQGTTKAHQGLAQGFPKASPRLGGRLGDESMRNLQTRMQSAHISD